MEPLAGKHRRRFSSAHPPEIPGQGQAAPLGLTLQLSLFLLSHPHLDGCRSLSVGHLIRSFLAGVIGVEPLSAHSAARFWGAPATQKLCSLSLWTGMRTLPTVNWRFPFAVLGRGIAVLSEWRSCPLSAALSRSLHGGGLGLVSHLDGHSVVRGKKEAGT